VEVRWPQRQVDDETRHRMRQVRRTGTAPELTLRRALREVGVRGYRLHWQKAPGRPDLAWVGRRLAVFVDGAFWHGHPSRYWPGRSGPYWDAKIAGNQARDRRNELLLASAGWRVMRLWDFEILQNVSECVERIRRALDERQD
jgi:DNA mismatch endonuclease (patch repair protein)